jgi:hypothetical protein
LPLRTAPPDYRPGRFALDNRDVQRRLQQIAELLEAQGADRFRVAAYRTAAQTIRDLRQPLDELLDEEGPAGLLRLPGVGRSLSRTIEQLVRTGRSALLERLRGANAPEKLLSSVPCIGRELAREIHHRLGIENLVELAAAAEDGRLAEVPGMGPKRIRAVRESLAGRFRHSQRTVPTPQEPPDDEPPVGELLDVDREYRLLAESDRLPRIAPRRFNPTGEAWLSVLHTQRNERHYTALYSNTARAHEMGATHDWVVIYRDDGDGQGRWTVITSQYGELQEKRIVRGREQECKAHYRQSE